MFLFPNWHCGFISLTVTLGLIYIYYLHKHSVCAIVFWSIVRWIKTKWYSSVFIISGAVCGHNFLIIIACWISFTYWNVHRCVLLGFSIHMVLVCALMMAVWSAILLHRSVCHIFGFYFPSLWVIAHLNITLVLLAGAT